MSKGHEECVKKLINKGCDINSISHLQTKTPLLTAIDFGQNKIATILIESRADINKQDIFDRRPISTAAYLGNLQIVIKLLQHGADYDAMGDEQPTALQVNVHVLQICYSGKGISPHRCLL